MDDLYELYKYYMVKYLKKNVLRINYTFYYTMLQINKRLLLSKYAKKYSTLYNFTEVGNIYINSIRYQVGTNKVLQ